MLRVFWHPGNIRLVTVWCWMRNQTNPVLVWSSGDLLMLLVKIKAGQKIPLNPHNDSCTEYNSSRAFIVFYGCICYLQIWKVPVVNTSHIENKKRNLLHAAIRTPFYSIRTGVKSIHLTVAQTWLYFFFKKIWFILHIFLTWRWLCGGGGGRRQLGRKHMLPFV